MTSSAFPSTYEITVERNRHAPILSTRSVGTDAVDAMWRVPGVDAVELLEEDVADEDNGRVKLSYLYLGDQRFETIDTHLEKFGLQRVRVSK